MCSIIGYKGEFKPSVVKKLLYNSRIRGLHAFGYAYYINSVLQVKKFLDYEPFVESLMTDKPTLFIAHFRYSTSGDYKLMENNQPLEDNGIAIAFNGVLSQKTKAEIELEYSVCLKSDNDGYLLLQKLHDNEFLSNRKISYAVVGLQNNQLFAARNANRPLYSSNTNGLLVVASTKDILDRSEITNSVPIEPNMIQWYD